MVTIIDGEFWQNFAVSPKEVLAALQAGLVLIGGASMGALRAVELHPYGMHGVGQIFRWYKTGRLTRDDDVAIVYTSGADGYRVQTTPMVNVIWTTDQAKLDGWLSPSTCRRVLTVARKTYWAERTWRGVCAMAKLTVEESRTLLDYASNPDNDLKRLDALAVVEYTRNLLTKIG